MVNNVRTHPRRGFTLVELIVVMAIVALLFGLTTVAISSAIESAKASKTRALITKLDGLVMPQWESYYHRRLPFTLPTAVRSPANGQPISLPPEAVAQVRCDALREIMRMEMPERWSDIDGGLPRTIPIWSNPITKTQYFNPSPPAGAGGPAVVSLAPSAVCQAYQNFFGPVADTSGFIANGYNHQGAKCLYLFLSMGVEDADVMENFSADESADVDGSGCKCFVDAWGNPIEFLRWAPGYKSALQHLPPTDRDQTDPTGVYGSPNPASGIPQTFALYPLVYSAGPDGYYDIVTDEDSSPPNHFSYAVSGVNNNPFYSTGGSSVGFSIGPIGTPAIEPVSDQATGRPIGNADNLDNHALGAH